MAKGYIGSSSTSKTEVLERPEVGFFCPHPGAWTTHSAPLSTNRDNDKEEYLGFMKKRCLRKRSFACYYVFKSIILIVRRYIVTF